VDGLLDLPFPALPRVSTRAVFFIKFCIGINIQLAEVVQHLPSKCEALSSNPSATKKKKKRNITYICTEKCTGPKFRLMNSPKLNTYI
jgi:hypothetical protein